MPEHPFHRTPLINIMQTQSGKWGSTLGSQLFGLFQPSIYLQSWITDMSHRQWGAKWYPFHDHFCILSNPWKPSLPSSPSSRLLPPGQRARCMKVRRHQGCLWSPRGCLGLKGWIIIMAAYTEVFLEGSPHWVPHVLGKAQLSQEDQGLESCTSSQPFP